MRPGSWISVLPLVMAAAIAMPSSRAAEAETDPVVERRLRALDGMADALRQTTPESGSEQRVDRGNSVNAAFVALIGEAVNPLFGVTALGMYTYFRAGEEERVRLPAHDQPAVWIPLLAVILLMLFNSTLCEAAPFLKTPLNALGDIVNKAGAAAMLPLAVKIFADSAAAPAEGAARYAGAFLFQAAQAAESGGTAGAAWHSFGWAAGAFVGTLVYGAVWMTFNVVDVLILICPFPGADAFLKSLRLAIVGILAGASQVSPTLAFLLAAALAATSFLTAGWSFRLSVFGFVLSTDILLFRRRRAADGPCSAFSSGSLKSGHGIPMRTLGRLEMRGDETLVFSYRPWLVLNRRRVELGNRNDFSAGMGLFNPFLVRDDNPGAPWLRFPPRYRGGEEDIARAFSLRRVTAYGVSGTLRSWLAAHFGKGRSRPEAA